MKINSAHNKILIFDSSKMLKIKNKLFNIRCTMVTAAVCSNCESVVSLCVRSLFASVPILCALFCQRYVMKYLYPFVADKACVPACVRVCVCACVRVCVCSNVSSRWHAMVSDFDCGIFLSYTLAFLYHDAIFSRAFNQISDINPLGSSFSLRPDSSLFNIIFREWVHNLTNSADAVCSASSLFASLAII